MTNLLRAEAPEAPELKDLPADGAAVGADPVDLIFAAIDAPPDLFFRHDVLELRVAIPRYLYRWKRTDTQKCRRWKPLDLHLLHGDMQLRFQVTVDDVEADETAAARPRVVRTGRSKRGPVYGLEPAPVLGVMQARRMINRFLTQFAPLEIGIKTKLSR